MTKAVGQLVEVVHILKLAGWYVELKARSESPTVNPKGIKWLDLSGRPPVLDEQTIRRIAFQLEQKCRDVKFCVEATVATKIHLMTTSKKTAYGQPLEEMAAAALNEQGFLFAQVVREKILGRLPGDEQKIWRRIADEYPVTAIDGSQTRIDLLLASGDRHVCLECKRANPKFKRWIFFDNGHISDPNQTGKIGVEKYHVARWPCPETERWHIIEQKPMRQPCSVFSAYLEVATKQDGAGGWKASHSETVEDALRQVVSGQSGLMSKLMNRESVATIYSVPVVITTAELFEAQFLYADVAISTGTLESKNLKLVPIDYCGVNYHADDSLALSGKNLSVRPDNLESFLLCAQARTVFVVNIEAVNRFLTWLHTSIFGG